MSDLIDRLMAFEATMANEEAELLNEAAEQITQLTREKEQLQQDYDSAAESLMNHAIRASNFEDSLREAKEAMTQAGRLVFNGSTFKAMRLLEEALQSISSKLGDK